MNEAALVGEEFCALKNWGVYLMKCNTEQIIPRGLPVIMFLFLLSQVSQSTPKQKLQENCQSSKWMSDRCFILLITNDRKKFNRFSLLNHSIPVLRRTVFAEFLVMQLYKAQNYC